MFLFIPESVFAMLTMFYYIYAATLLAAVAALRNVSFTKVIENLSCAYDEKVFQENPVSLLTCTAKCSDMESCKSISFDAGWCRGCSEWHVNSTGLESRPYGVIYNKATGNAGLGEVCGINPCLEMNQECAFIDEDLAFKCRCKLGSQENNGYCLKVSALDGELCSTMLPCFSSQYVICSSEVGVCECTNGATYFPDTGQCLIADVPYQQDCSVNACIEPNQICNDQICVCNHGYTYDSTQNQCVTDCSTYGNTFQDYPMWTLIGHVISEHAYVDATGCKELCASNSVCRSCTIVYLGIVFTCYLHDVTSLDVVPFWEYHINILCSHHVRNCQ